MVIFIIVFILIEDVIKIFAGYLASKKVKCLFFHDNSKAETVEKG